MGANPNTDEWGAELAQLLCEIPDPTDMIVVLEALCTKQELARIAQRLRIGRLLHAGGTYRSIREETGAGTEFISRAKRELVMNKAFEKYLDGQI